ncbi:hypothetical protein K6V26_14720 [Parabacteroides goldsteinii]|uniref:hypothetical protein n=1 Tax=Parabacteroides goldsteinii TaxID=328812 RepID=UPI001CCA4B65|nr:hypothetical protein [Parabacteroides goldsteinii]UBD77504.1 hypothetical protein K6V26_14720 [Parabacteroides goldsteinii]
MADNKEQVILEVVIKNDAASKRLKENKQDIAELREEQALLNKTTLEGKEAYKRYEDEIKNLRKHNLLLNQEIRNNNKSIEDQEGSLQSMRAELSRLNKVYVNLSQAERESAKGRDLQKKILSLNTTIGDAEKKLGDFRRQVGNYENAMKSALGANNKYVATLMLMKDGNMNLGAALKTTTSVVISFGKALFAAIMANPIIAVIAGIVAVLTGLVKIMRGNEEQSARLDAVLAPLKRTFEGIVAVLQIVAGWVLDVAEGFEALALQVTKLGEKIPVIGKYFKQSNDAMLASIQLSKDKAALDKQTRELDVANAKAQYESSELRKKAEDRVKYTAEERLKFVQEANAKEQEILDNRLKIAEEQFRIAQEEATYNENSKEVNEDLTKMEANLYLVRKEHSDKTKELMTKENEIRNQSLTAEKTRLAQAKKATEEAVKQKQKELELIRQAEDAALSLVKEGIEKQRQVINVQYDRQIEDLKRKLSTEKNLTDAAKKALNDSIILAEQKRDADLKKLSDDSIQVQIKKETERIQLQLDSVKEGTSQEHNLRLSLIEQNRQAELAANLQLAEELRQSEVDINAAYNKLIADENEAFRKEQFDKQSEYIRLEWENKILQLREGTLQEYDLKVQQAQADYDLLVNMDAATKAALYESDIEYTNAVLQSQKRITEAKQAQVNAENEFVLMQIEAATTVTDAFSSMIDTFAEDNENLAAFAKTVALFNIGLSTAEALAKGVASAQAVGFPANIPAIATTIAAIMANIVKAKQLVSKEKNPKYADGGEITGPSHASGGVLIEAEGGEGIINKHSMSNPLLRSIASAVNVAGGGVPFSNVPIFPSGSSGGFDTAELKAVFVEALKEMPVPVVSVVEFTEVQDRVKMIQNNSTI